MIPPYSVTKSPHTGEILIHDLLGNLILILPSSQVSKLGLLDYDEFSLYVYIHVHYYDLLKRAIPSLQ